MSEQETDATPEEAHASGHGSAQAAAGARPFRCHALGEVALYPPEDGDQPILGSSKPVALLAYLALSPNGRANRDHVAELFWRSSSATDAHHSLRQALYRLRSAAEGRELVLSQKGDLELTDRVSFDFLEGETVLSGGDLTRAYRLLWGRFLEGFSIPDSREFEGWADAQRSRFADAWARAAFALVQERMRAGDAEGALEPAERLVALQPFDDAPIGLLLGALAGQGRHAAALARYQAYVDLLRNEVEQEPGAKLQAFAREIEVFLREKSFRAARELPFVGRSEEWGVFETAWEATRTGEGTLLFVEGAAGLGKTRLISEISERVRAAGGTTLHAKCYEVERAVPYAVLAEALAPTIERPELAELGAAWVAEAARLFPELRDRFPAVPRSGEPGSAGASKRRLHQALLRWLEVLAEKAPLLLTVDDVHWADASSLEVLHFLVHKLRDRGVLLVISYRPAELVPAARRFTRALSAAQLADVRELKELDKAAVEDLLDQMGDFDARSVHRAVASHLHRHSGGNPLFLSELIEAVAHERVLWVAGGRWQLGRRARIEDLPRTLGKLMSDRLDRLDPWMRACVETLSVLAGGGSVEVLARVLNLSEPRAELALALLGEERLVRATGPGEFDLIHDELRHLVYQGVPDERRRLLHLEVGSALEAFGEERRPGGPARLAYHFDQAGEHERAHRFALLAVGEAETFAASEARREHLALATAHSPKALPPGTDPEADDEDAFARAAAGRRRAGVRLVLVAAAAISLLGLGAFGAIALRERLFAGGSSDYRQGTLYLATGAFGPANFTHVVRWPSTPEEPGTIEAIENEASGLPPNAINQWVSMDGESHLKVFRVSGRDTLQLTYGPSDDNVVGWSPDGRHLLIHRGWRATAERFEIQLVLLNVNGTELRSFQPCPWAMRAVWSPSGTQLLVQCLLTESTLYLTDADGTHLRDLSQAFGLPSAASEPAFAPDGRRIALLYRGVEGEGGRITIIDLELGTKRRLVWPHPSQPVGYTLQWSPDGRWLVYVAPIAGGPETGLWALSEDGVSGPHLVARMGSLGVTSVLWTGAPPAYATAVTIDRPTVQLDVGGGTRVSAAVLAPEGDPLSVPVRWSTTDTTVARVDTLGFVQGRSAGGTILVASAGGLLADTIAVSVGFSPVDTLFTEDWRRPLDMTRWIPFGEPPPRVVAGAVAGGQPAFVSGGDYNRNSGAYTRQGFEPLGTGLTVEVEGWFGFTGSDWQDWIIGIGAPRTGSARVGTGEPDAPVIAYVQGPNERTRPGLLEGCRASERWTGPLASTEWHRFAIQIRPDTIAECWVEGRLLGRQRLPTESWGNPIRVVLSGRMEGTELYHGRVVVTRGLRY